MKFRITKKIDKKHWHENGTLCIAWVLDICSHFSRGNLILLGICDRASSPNQSRDSLYENLDGGQARES